MSKLGDYLAGTDQTINYPDDIRQLQEAIPEIRNLPLAAIDKMYRDYSDTFAASWLCIDDDRIEDFKRWLL